MGVLAPAYLIGNGMAQGESKKERREMGMWEWVEEEERRRKRQ